MADVYRIQAAIDLGGNIAPELARILKTLSAIEKSSKGVEKSIGRWASPIDRASASMGHVAREMANVQRSANRVEREIGRAGRAMQNLKAPAGGMDREIQKWAAAMQRPLAEMRHMRTETQGVSSAARGVSRSIDSWASKINSAAAAMKRMSSAAAGVHLPNVPQGGGGRNGGGRNTSGGRHQGGQNSSRRGHGRQLGEHEGSHLAGFVGVTGGLSSLEYLVAQGAGGVREDIRAKNAGISSTENAVFRAQAGELSRLYPSLSQLGVREQARLLIPNVGDVDKARELLPEYMRAQVALQTTSGVEGGEKDVAHMQRAIDLVGRSQSVMDTRKILDGFVRSRQLDPEAVKGNDFVNAAQSAGSAGKALSADFWSSVMPALFMQQGGSRTGTDVASAFQNTVIGRGTNESILAQYDQGYRTGTTFKTDKNGKRKLLNKGSFIDEELYSSNFHEWNKKHVVPKMAAKGMLPEGWASGDFSQKITDEQRAAGTKYISEMFSNRRGASLHTMDILEMDQMESILKRLRNARGTQDVLSDQKNDPMIAGKSLVTQAGNVGSAAAGPAIPTITTEANRLAAVLGRAADTLEKHPIFAHSAFGTGAAAVGGAAAAGITALTLAGIGMLSLPALTVGAGATVTIAEAIIPWGAIGDGMKGVLRDAFPDWYKKNEKAVDQTQKGAGWFGSMPGYGKLLTQGKLLGGLGKMLIENTVPQAARVPGVGPNDFSGGLPSATPQGAKTLPELPGLGGALPSLPKMGSYGSPPAVAPGANAVAGLGPIESAAKDVPGAIDAAAGAISSFVSRVLGGLNANAAAAAPISPGSKDGGSALVGSGPAVGASAVAGMPTAAGGSTEVGADAGSAPAAIKQASDAIGAAGSAAATAGPSLSTVAGNVEKAGTAAGASAVGFDAAATGANSAAGAANSAGSALAGLAAKISGLPSIGLPAGAKPTGGVAPGAVGAAPDGGGGAPTGGGSAAPSGGGKQSYAPPPRSYAPIQVASTIMMNERAVGRAVTRHQVAEANTRNGTQSFDDNVLKTPVGYSAPLVA